MHGNQILGVDAASPGGRFDVGAALEATGASLGTWPRTDVDGLQQGIDALVDGAPALAGTAPDDRRTAATRMVRAIGRDEDLVRWLAARFGVDVQELAPHTSDLEARVARLLSRGLDDGSGEGGEEGEADASAGVVSLVIPDWSELLLGTTTAVLAELLAGRPTLVLADPRVPRLGDAIVRAAEGCGFPAASLAVLHGADVALLRAAVRSPRVGRAVVSGSPERLLVVHEAAAARPSEAPLTLAEDVPRGVTLRLEDDAATRVDEVVRRAFGRSETLSGQLPGRVEAVVCEPRAFSAFTGALLSACERSSDVQKPVPMIDAAAVQGLQDACARGLDEGATLIHGGVPKNGGVRDRGLVVPPTIFTNVEPGMDLLTRVAPGPILRLVRAD